MKNLNTRFLYRKINAVLMLIAITAFSMSSLNAQTYVGGSATIPSSGIASVYPLTVDVDAVGVIASVTATVTISHTWPDDIDILLVSPTGAMSMVMSDAGGSGDITALTISFDQTAASSVPDAGPLTAGPYKPTDISPGETMTAPAPVGPYTANFGNFTGTDPNGTWSLYVLDDTGGDLGSIVGWSLTITLAEPCTDPPTAGTTMLSPSAACSGAGFTASLTGGTSGDGQTYQWQSSPDGDIWTDIDGATSSSYAGVASEPLYYRCVVTCGASSDESDPALLSVTTTPTGNTSADPIVIASLPFVADGDNLTANCWTNTIGAAAPDVWYSYTAACDGSIDIDLCTASWDSYLRIYDAGLLSIGGDDDTEPLGCYSLSSSVENFPVTSGTTYFIVVDAFSIGEGTYTLSVNPIDISPSGDITVCYGEIVTLTATAGYDTYQWYKNGNALPGATSSSLNTKKPGYYQVEAANGGCSVVSEPQAIAVALPPLAKVKAIGGSADLCSSGSVLIGSVTWFGSTYQWYKDGVAIDGATGGAYTATEVGDYTLEVTYGACVKMSDVVTVYSSCREGMLPNEFAIYPNPAKENLVISASFFNGQSGSPDIYIYNSVGQIVYFGSVEMSNGHVNETISLPNLAAGVYTFMLQSGSSIETTQLIIAE